MTKKTPPPEVTWLKDRQRLLSIFQIEKELGMGQNTLRNFLKGFYGLNEHWWPAVVSWVRNFVAMQPNSAPKKAQTKPAAPKSIKPKETATKKRLPEIAAKQGTENKRLPYMSDAIKKKLGR